MTLYLQAARAVLPSLQDGTSVASLFGPDSVHARAVLQLVWREWQSPVDGVADLMRSALSTLLDLCGRENKGRGQDNSEVSHLAVWGFFSVACRMMPSTMALT